MEAACEKPSCVVRRTRLHHACVHCGVCWAYVGGVCDLCLEVLRYCTQQSVGIVLNVGQCARSRRGKVACRVNILKYVCCQEHIRSTYIEEHRLKRRDFHTRYYNPVATYIRESDVGTHVRRRRYFVRCLPRLLRPALPTRA